MWNLCLVAHINKFSLSQLYVHFTIILYSMHILSIHSHTCSPDFCLYKLKTQIVPLQCSTPPHGSHSTSPLGAYWDVSLVTGLKVKKSHGKWVLRRISIVMHENYLMGGSYHLLRQCKFNTLRHRWKGHTTVGGEATIGNGETNSTGHGETPSTGKLRLIRI